MDSSTKWIIAGGVGLAALLFWETRKASAGVANGLGQGLGGAKPQKLVVGSRYATREGGTMYRPQADLVDPETGTIRSTIAADNAINLPTAAVDIVYLPYGGPAASWIALANSNRSTYEYGAKPKAAQADSAQAYAIDSEISKALVKYRQAYPGILA